MGELLLQECDSDLSLTLAAAAATHEGNNNPRVSRIEYVLSRIEKLIGFVRIPGNIS